MPDLLIELFSEEIPARMQARAREDLKKLVTDGLVEAGLTYASAGAFSTPRRLTLVLEGLTAESRPVREERKGPATTAPQQAIDGFLRATGLTLDQLERRADKKGETFFAVIEKPGRKAEAIVAEVLDAAIRTFPWPKSMRWGNGTLRWVRPLHSILCLLTDEAGATVVPLTVEGITAGNTTEGHRFLSPGRFAVHGYEDYAAKLKRAHVILDSAEREAAIWHGAQTLAFAAGMELVEDKGLLAEVAGLVEWPVPLMGRIADDFLGLPPEVLQTSMKEHQKFFSVRNPKTGRIEGFVTVANTEAADQGATILKGNQKVLAARLSDARFFWEQDKKKPLSVHAEKLGRITFHEKLGTVADKVERVAKLARWLCEENIVVPAKAGTALAQSAKSKTIPASAGMTNEQLADLAEQAARLAKADLVTEMVGEFPELQGLMGGYYAAKEGLPQEVAEAIRDHYKPVGQGDDVPTAPVTVAVSLADKLDTLVGFFVIDEKPTGSKDPFALRRAALGNLASIQQNGLRLSLFKCFDFAAKLIVDQNPQIKSRLAELGEASFGIAASENMPLSKNYADQVAFEIEQIGIELLAFFADRLKVQQREAGVRHDLIDAVFALGGEDDLVRLLARVHALQAFVGTEDGTNLLAGYKRAANILKKEGYEGPTGTPDPQVLASLKQGNDTIPDTGEEDPLAMVDDPDVGDILAAEARGNAELSYTPEPAEKALIDALDAAAPRAAAAVEAEQFADAMAALATLRAPIDRFFEEVTVNAEEAHKRAARLALLARFRDAVHRVADFSRIEG